MTRITDPELELLETGALAPTVIPEVTRDPDGRLRIGCRYRCPLPPAADVADAIRMLVAHSEVGS